ncbi:hypothetical protein Efla_005681 [Eimeria flavescens]
MALSSDYKGFDSERLAAESLCSLLCKEAAHKYVCPKCKLLFCSVPCYKEHSAGCVAAFYESEFADAAAAAAPTLHERREFSKTLSRVYHEQQQQQQQEEEEEAVKGLGFDSSEDDDDVSDAAEEEQQQQQQQEQQQQIEPQRLQHLQQLAAAGSLDLQHLTPKETQAFFSAIKRGELAQYLQPWKPWWLSIELPNVDAPPHVCCRPKRADPRLAMSLLQLLFAYAHCMRTFNGKVEDAEVEEAAAHLLAIARGLEQKEPPPSSAVAAVDQALGWAAQPPLGCTDSAFAEVCLSDVCRLLSSRDFAIKAAADAATLITRFKTSMQQQQQQQQQQQEEEDVQRPSPKEMRKLGGWWLEPQTLNPRFRVLLFAVAKSEFVLKKLNFIVSAFYFHWAELLQQQQQQLLHALQQRAKMLQQVQQIKKQREESQKAARMLDPAGSTKFTANSRQLQGEQLVAVLPDCSSSSSSSSSKRADDEGLKREAL